MANKHYIERLQMVINQLHKCDSTWIKSVTVHELFRGETIWQGDVEVFDLTGHPKAQCCYAWSHSEPEQFITILQLPPVETAADAVKVGVSHLIKELRKKAKK